MKSKPSDTSVNKIEILAACSYKPRVFWRALQNQLSKFLHSFSERESQYGLASGNAVLSFHTRMAGCWWRFDQVVSNPSALQTNPRREHRKICTSLEINPPAKRAPLRCNSCETSRLQLLCDGSLRSLQLYDVELIRDMTFQLATMDHKSRGCSWEKMSCAKAQSIYAQCCKSLYVLDLTFLLPWELHVKLGDGRQASVINWCELCVG